MEKTKTSLTNIEHEIEDVLKRPLHLHVEYFFRKPYVLLAVMSLMAVAIIKSDGRFLGLMKDAYNHGYSTIGAYLREESVRTPTTVAIAKPAVISSK